MTGATIPINKFKADVGPWESSGEGESGAGKCAWGTSGMVEGGIWPPSGASLYVHPGLSVWRAEAGTNMA